MDSGWLIIGIPKNQWLEMIPNDSWFSSNFGNKKPTHTISCGSNPRSFSTAAQSRTRWF